MIIPAREGFIDIDTAQLWIRKILLKIRRLSRERIGFVIVENPHQTSALRAVICGFEQCILREEILGAQIPLLHLALAEIALHAISVIGAYTRGLRQRILNSKYRNGVLRVGGTNCQILDSPKRVLKPELPI